MTFLSDRVEPVQVTEKAHAAILLRVARVTLGEARAAWRAWETVNDLRRLRVALRTAVLAARSARRAAEKSRDAIVTRRLLDDAAKLDATAAELQSLIATAVTGED